MPRRRPRPRPVFLPAVLFTALLAPAPAWAEAEPAKTKPVEVTWHDGVQFRSADGSAQVRVGGFIDADGRFYPGDDAGLATDQFLIRRARLLLDVSFLDRFEARLAPDFGQSKPSLFDAYLDVRFHPLVRLRAGKTKPPIDLERLQGGTELMLVERGAPAALIPNRDVGMLFWGETADQLVSWSAGVFNGVPDGATSETETNDGKDFVARVFARPFRRGRWTSLRGLGLGVGGSRGNESGALPSYKSDGQVSVFSYASAAVADGRRTRLAPQLSWYAGRFGLLAEQAVTRQAVASGALAADLRNRAWMAEASWVLTGEPASFKGLEPARPMGPAGAGGPRGFGAVEIAARADALRIDRDAFPSFADPAVSVRRAGGLALGVNWYLNHFVKIALQLVRTRFRGGAAAGDREDENAVLFRLQIRS
jgi:phosphate-selective porin OprO/OprP